MHRSKPLLSGTTILVLFTLALAGCVVVPARPYATAAPVVMVAPPPPQVEIRSPLPAAGYVWLGGYWAWRGSSHYWVSGHWEAQRPDHYWVPHGWVSGGGGWRLNQGHWARR